MRLWVTWCGGLALGLRALWVGSPCCLTARTSPAVTVAAAAAASDVLVVDLRLQPEVSGGRELLAAFARLPDLLLSRQTPGLRT